MYQEVLRIMRNPGADGDPIPMFLRALPDDISFEVVDKGSDNNERISYVLLKISAYTEKEVIINREKIYNFSDSLGEIVIQESKKVDYVGK